MTDIKINGKIFRKSITGEEINSQISRIAASIDSDYKGKKPLLLGVLNGCFMFASDLMKQLHIECEISFVKLSSYQGTTTTGTVPQVSIKQKCLENTVYPLPLCGTAGRQAGRTY